MPILIETSERSNGMQVIKIVFENGNTFNLRAYPNGKLEINGGFCNGLLIKPHVSNEVEILHDNS